MHAATLEKLKDHLVKAKRAIDIGTGSGYIAACFAEMIPDDSQVIMLDHIPELIDFAEQNIKKDNLYLFKKNKIRSIVADGRYGCPGNE
mmetsp:Transcript_22890/g.17340  ORF Transcript_22890/g.17340 Transcript_22890/m.17340 type:complete len:89 (+) Transcript_22890:903-1169(+)